MTEPFKQHKKQAPLAIHPDDAKDKVFAAILKALIKMGNTPSSPKELANTIVKHKYATLGGQTPFATVSSRISQHFKRAAQHKPPRAPLLTKHVDQNHSRKINYSLATEDIHDNNKTISVTTKESVSSDSSSELSSEEEEVEEDDDDSTRSPIVKHARTATSTSKSKSTTMTMLRSSNNVDPTKQQPQDNNDDIAAAITMTKLSKQANNESDGEHSDYYEEMMLEDNTLETKNSPTTTPTQESKESITTNLTTNPTTITTSLQQQQIKKSSTPLSVVGENEYWAPFSFEQEFESAFLSAADNSIESPESISLLQFDAVKCNVNTPPPSTSPPPISSSHHRAGSLNSDTTAITNALNENDSKHSRRQSWPNDKLASSASKEGEGKESRKEKCQVVTSTFNGHTFKITKKWIGNMEFYELDSPDDIPDTKILRFIASSNHSNTPKELKRNYVNATQLRKAATPVLGEGHFDAEEEQKQNGNVVVISGKSIAEGVWVPLHRARELVEDFEIESSPGLTKLLSDHPLDEGGEIYSLPRQASSLDFSDQLTNTLMKEANSRLSDQDPNLPSKPNKEIVESLSIRNEKKQSPHISTTATSSNTSISPSSSSSSSSTAPTSFSSSNKIRKHTKIAPSTKHLSASDILKSMNIQNLNLSALQHMMAAVPNLAQGAPPPPNLNFAKILESYMSGTKAPATASVPVADASSSSATLKQPPMQDLKSALSRIPLLDALLLNTQKQQSASYQQKILPQPSTPGMAGSSDSGTTTTASSPTSMASSTLTTASEPLVIHPTQPTEPPMSITVTDNIAVCIATLKKQEGEGEAKQEKEYQVMRRLDNGFVNGTQLLTAGGIETESERSMILSFEMSRVRMPNKKSGLFGTWIPSRRALELAATCSIQHALGPFLDDDIESLFPSPLPSAVLSAAKSRRKRSNSTTSSTSGSNSNSHHLAAITLAALKNPVDHQVVSHLASKRNSTDSSSSLNILTHPNNTLKMVADSHTLQAPLLGSFLNTDGDRLVTVIDKSVASTNPMSSVGNNTTTTTAATTPFSNQNDKDNNSDVDIESEDAFMSDLVRLDDGSSSSEDENTDTDNDVEEVRKKMRKMRDAAIAAMEVESPLQLDDIFPQHDSQPPPSSSFFQQEPKRRRRSSSGAGGGGGSGGGGSHRKRKRKLKKRAAAVDKDNAVDSLDEEEEEDDTTDEMDAIKNHFIQSQHATPYKSFNYSRKRPAGLSGGTGGKWSASSIKMAPKAIKRSATWSGSMNTPIGSIAKRQRQQSAKAAKEVNALSLSVPATTLNISTPKKDAGSQTNKTSSTILSTIKSSKKRANSLITHTVVNEEDEDEEVDIGGSDNNDDLR